MAKKNSNQQAAVKYILIIIVGYFIIYILILKYLGINQGAVQVINIVYPCIVFLGLLPVLLNYAVKIRVDKNTKLLKE